MKTTNATPPNSREAFSLIELLVVIAVIAILAALLFPVTAVIKKNRVLKVSQAELGEVQTAIESYKTSRGTYPPDNPANYLINPLFFELKGTVLTNLGGTPTYVTLDGGGQIPKASVLATFGVGGFVNSSASAKGDDDRAAAQNFLKDLKPGQSASVPAGSMVKLLTSSVVWELPSSVLVPSGDAGMNPWRYVSSHPTNNVGSYDLWIDVVIAGKTNRISNWSKTPQVVAY